MVAILRVQARWGGFSGAPGYSAFHFRDFGTGEGTGTDGDVTQSQAAADKLTAFFSTIADRLPEDLTVQPEAEVEMLEDTTGELLDVFGITPLPPVLGVGLGNYSGPVGAVVNWRTALVKNGRRIRGRTFLVPLVAASFGADGGLSSIAQSDIQNAANTLSATDSTPDLGVYSRPSAVGATDGQWAVVSSTSVPVLAAVLRSRRD